MWGRGAVEGGDTDRTGNTITFECSPAELRDTVIRLRGYKTREDVIGNEDAVPDLDSWAEWFENGGLEADRKKYPEIYSMTLEEFANSTPIKD